MRLAFDRVSTQMPNIVKFRFNYLRMILLIKKYTVLIYLLCSNCIHHQMHYDRNSIIGIIESINNFAIVLLQRWNSTPMDD